MRVRLYARTGHTTIVNSEDMLGQTAKKKPYIALPQATPLDIRSQSWKCPALSRPQLVARATFCAEEIEHVHLNELEPSVICCHWQCARQMNDIDKRQHRRKNSLTAH